MRVRVRVREACIEESEDHTYDSREYQDCKDQRAHQVYQESQDHPDLVDRKESQESLELQ